MAVHHPGDAGLSGPALGPGRRVRLHLGIWLADGTEVLSSFEEAPLDLRIGDGTMTPGLEALLAELAVGEDRQWLIDGDLIFGPRDGGAIRVIDRNDLPAGFSAEPGQVLAFTTPGGQETTGTVLGWEADGLGVDFNHPLSAAMLRIRARLLAVGDDA